MKYLIDAEQVISYIANMQKKLSTENIPKEETDIREYAYTLLDTIIGEISTMPELRLEK